MTVYGLLLETLSPVHIGEGRELRQGFDFVCANGCTYRLDEDACLEAYWGQLANARGGHYPTPGELLKPADLERSQLFRYVLRGMPRSAKADARVQSFIKDVNDRPYIPGSSLKGALRTGLAWAGWKEVMAGKLDRNAFGRNKSWAAQPLERQLFGRDPNHDLLRAVQVSDLHGMQQPGEGLVLVNAQVLTYKSQGSPVELETLAGGNKFAGTLKVDDYLLKHPTLGLKNRSQWVDELLPRVQAHSQARIQTLLKWFHHLPPEQNCHRVAGFYEQLAGVKLGPNQALVQLGWGSGWDGKTYGTHLQQDPRLFGQLVADFRMYRGRVPWSVGRAFPSSRRVVMLIKNGVAAPATPFGWVLITMTRE